MCWCACIMLSYVLCGVLMEMCFVVCGDVLVDVVCGIGYDGDGCVCRGAVVRCLMLMMMVVMLRCV